MTRIRPRRPLAVRAAASLAVGLACVLVLEASPASAAILPAPRLPAIATVKSSPPAKETRSVPAASAPGTGLFDIYGGYGEPPAFTQVTLPAGGGVPLMADWDGDGLAMPGRFDNGTWFRATGIVDTPTWTPVVSGFGSAADTPVTGRLTKQGLSLGLFREGAWTWRLPDGTTRNDSFGQAGDVPIVGDWDGDGIDDLGVVRQGSWILRLSGLKKAPKAPKSVAVQWVPEAKAAVLTFGFGTPGATALVGDWNGDGTDTPATVEGSKWTLSLMGWRKPKKTAVITVPLTTGQVPLVGTHATAPGHCPTASPALEAKALRLLPRTRGPKKVQGTTKVAGMPEIQATVQDGLRYLMTNDLTKRRKLSAARPYYDALSIAASQEESIRRQSNAAQSAAIMATTSNWTKVNGISRAQLVNYAKWHIRSVACQHDSITPGGWGNSFQSALWATSAGMAGWLLWNELSTQERAYVAAMVAAEADHSVARGPFYMRNRAGKDLTAGDSRADEVSWDLMAPALAMAMLPRDPRQGQWRATLASLGIAAFSRPSDLTSSKVINGVKLSSLPGTNANEDGTVTNHGKVNPDYTQNVSHLWWAASMMRQGGASVPEAVFHNSDDVYRALAVVNFPSPPYAPPGGTVYQPLGQIYYPMGAGWGTRRPASFVGVDGFAATYASKDTKAPEFLAAHARDARALQLRWNDGHMYAPGSGEETYRLGKEEYAIQQMALAWYAEAIKRGTKLNVDRSKIPGIDLNPRVPIPQ